MAHNMPHDATWLYLKRSRYSFVFGYFHHVLRTAHQESRTTTSVLENYGVLLLLLLCRIHLVYVLCCCSCCVFCGLEQGKLAPKRGTVGINIDDAATASSLRSQGVVLIIAASFKVNLCPRLRNTLRVCYLIEPELNMSIIYSIFYLGRSKIRQKSLHCPSF